MSPICPNCGPLNMTCRYCSDWKAAWAQREAEHGNALASARRAALTAEMTALARAEELELALRQAETERDSWKATADQAAAQLATHAKAGARQFRSLRELKDWIGAMIPAVRALVQDHHPHWVQCRDEDCLLVVRLLRSAPSEPLEAVT